MRSSRLDLLHPRRRANADMLMIASSFVPSRIHCISGRLPCPIKANFMLNLLSFASPSITCRAGLAVAKSPTAMLFEAFFTVGPKRQPQNPLSYAASFVSRVTKSGRYTTGNIELSANSSTFLNLSCTLQIRKSTGSANARSRLRLVAVAT